MTKHARIRMDIGVITDGLDVEAVDAKGGYFKARLDEHEPGLCRNKTNNCRVNFHTQLGYKMDPPYPILAIFG